MKRRVVVITGAGGTLGAALSGRFAGEPETDLVLSDLSDASLAPTIDGLPGDRGAVETVRRRRERDRTGRGGRRARGRALRPARRADQQRRCALAQRSHPQPHRPTTGSARSASTSSARSTASAPRSRPCATQQSGSIILTASVSGLTAWSHAAPYCATKAAVIQLAKVAAVEYARDGIRVNCVCPGTFRSGIHAELPEQAIDAIAAKHPLGLAPRRRPGRRVLVSRERRVPLDDRIGDRRRRRLRRAVGADRCMPT